MTRSPVLLFDIGGVLVDNIGFARLNSLLSAPIDEVALRERLLVSKPWRCFELGQISAEQFARDFVAEWQLPLSPEQFIAEFAGWPRGFYPGAEAWLRRLRQQYRVAALTNCNSIHWQRFEGFATHFDVVYSSHLLGLIKPDAAIFEHVVAALGVPAHEIVFFDDSPSNVAAARQLGMRAQHVLGFEALRAALAAPLSAPVN